MENCYDIEGEFVERSSLESIVSFLRHVPTGDNSQHWHYKMGESSIFVHHDELRAKHVLNEGHHASLLSLGTLVETTSIWCGAMGYALEVEYFLEDLNNSHFATLSFRALAHKPSSEDKNLLGHVDKRETNRNHFKKVGVPPETIKTIQQHIAPWNIQISERSRPSKKLFDYLVTCEKYIWHNRKVFLDTSKWIRFNEEEYINSKDGFNLKNIRLNKLDALFVKLFRKSDLFVKFFWALGMRLKVHLDTTSAIKNTGSFIIFSSISTKREDIINTGRSMYRTWITLNKDGYAVQPLSTASLLAFNLKSLGSLQGCSQKYKESFMESKNIFMSDYNLTEKQNVIWMIRTGPAKTLEENARTLRKESSFFLETLNESNE
jgi:hypothetical protein